ncbi:MAG TPA: hypothetical protein VF808_00750 [Ktedonobacterales bacterium]
MRNITVVARKFLETRAGWKRLEQAVTAQRAEPGSPLAVRAGKAKAAARALAWTLGIDLDLLERPKRLERAAPVVDAPDPSAEPDVSGLSGLSSLFNLSGQGAAEIQAVLDAEGPVQIIPVQLGSNGRSDRPAGRWYLLDVPPHIQPDGYRTELWSAFFSHEQLEELREAVSLTRLTLLTPDDQLGLPRDSADAEVADLSDLSDHIGGGE